MVKKSWEQLHSDCLKLIDEFGSYRPDVVCPCMLGGLISAAIIAKTLGISDVRPIDIERKGDERRLAYDVHGSLKGKKVLILEDDLPTGKGPAVIKRLFEQRGSEVKIGALYVTPEGAKVADFFVEEMPQLPDYPWKKHHAGDRLRG